MTSCTIHPGGSSACISQAGYTRSEGSSKVDSLTKLTLMMPVWQQKLMLIAARVCGTQTAGR